VDVRRRPPLAVAIVTFATQPLVRGRTACWPGTLVYALGEGLPSSVRDRAGDGIRLHARIVIPGPMTPIECRYGTLLPITTHGAIIICHGDPGFDRMVAQ
jgi:hypothetical protein